MSHHANADKMLVFVFLFFQTQAHAGIFPLAAPNRETDNEAWLVRFSWWRQKCNMLSISLRLISHADQKILHRGVG